MKADPKALYKVWSPSGVFAPMTAAEFVGCIGNQFPTSTLPNPQLPWGQWYCQNPDCVVREVEIFCKLRGEQMPSVMKCPACVKAMKFHHWLDSETLLPQKAGAE